MARAKWQDHTGSHLALARNPIDDSKFFKERQQFESSIVLANLLLYQWGNFIEIVFVNKARASIDLKA